MRLVEHGPEAEAPADNVATGRLRQVPVLAGIPRISKVARKEATIVAKEAERALRERASALSASDRTRKVAARRLDALTKHLVIPLRDHQRELRAFLRGLHPFERELVRLTLAARERTGEPSFADIMERTDAVRKRITTAGKAAAAACSELRAARDVEAHDVESERALLEALDDAQPVWEDLQALSALVRRLPAVRTEEPLAVLVGMPNVGKSSLVGALSTAAPEVNAYPFTTKRLTLGHVNAPAGHARLQVMDTPGVLDRDADSRNAIEALTFCALAELRVSAVVFVLDVTGTSAGEATIERQLNVRAAMRRENAHVVWMDVLNKCDLANAHADPNASLAAIEAAIAAGADGEVDSRARVFRVSAATGEGVDALRTALEVLIDDDPGATDLGGRGAAGPPPESLGKRALERWADADAASR